MTGIYILPGGQAAINPIALQVAEACMGVVPESWIDNGRMKRIICHWSGGGYKASDLDRRHYHILIEDDGELVRGFHSIAANESARDGDYAAHTRRANSGAIGIAVCCMDRAEEGPFRAGPAPMTQRQWETMAAVAAELCRAYEIPVTPTTVLGHGEVERHLGILQEGKWDPLVLPWDTERSKREVGDAFRARVLALLDGVEDAREPARVKARITGKGVSDAISMNEDSFVRISDVLAALALEAIDTDGSVVAIARKDEGDLIYVPCCMADGTPAPVATVLKEGYVSVRRLAESLGLPVAFDVSEGVLDVGGPIARKAEGAEPPVRTVTVKSGDTLSQIAERYLGSARKWPLLRRPNGEAFTEESARRLKLGETIVLPDAAPPGTAAAISAEAAGGAPDLDRVIAAAAPGLAAVARLSVPAILSECAAQGVTQAAHVAYVLATAEHESKCGRFMRELWGPTRAQRGYEGRKDLGNVRRGDGFRYRGRGFVQLTGRANYETWDAILKSGILEDPERVATDSALAARILVQGMREGRFRGRHKLDDFLGGGEPDFFNARDIINGDKHLFDAGQPGNRGTRIAEIAGRYLAALTPG